MRKLLLALALTLVGAHLAWADSITTVVNATTEGSGRQTVTVFNDAGSALTSGAVVIWDSDDTEFDRSGYPYVTTTTTADHVWTAGVLLNDSCADQTLCEIVTQGWAATNINTGLTEDTVVSTSTTAGRAGDATAGNNVCYLGRLIENFHLPTAVACTAGSSFCQAPVYVDVTCAP